MSVGVLGVVPHGVLGQGVHRLLLDQVRHRFQVARRRFVQFDVFDFFFLIGLSWHKIVLSQKNSYNNLLFMVYWWKRIAYLLESKNIIKKKVFTLHCSIGITNFNTLTTLVYGLSLKKCFFLSYVKLLIFKEFGYLRCNHTFCFQLLLPSRWRTLPAVPRSTWRLPAIFVELHPTMKSVLRSFRHFVNI